MFLKLARNKKGLIYYTVDSAKELIKQAGLKVSARRLKQLQEESCSECEIVERIVEKTYPNNLVFVEHLQDEPIRVCVFENPVAPKVVLTLDGGLIQDVKADSPVEVLKLDVDTEGADASELSQYKDEGGEDAEACAGLWSGKEILSPDWVKQVHDVVVSQIKKIQKVY